MGSIQKQVKDKQNQQNEFALFDWNCHGCWAVFSRSPKSWS